MLYSKNVKWSLSEFMILLLLSSNSNLSFHKLKSVLAYFKLENHESKEFPEKSQLQIYNIKA